MYPCPTPLQEFHSRNVSIFGRLFFNTVKEMRYALRRMLGSHNLASHLQFGGTDLQQKPILLQIAEAVPSRILSVKRKKAMSLHLVGIGGPMHNVANMYGMGHSTVSKVFYQFIAAIINKSTFIHWPRTPLELEQVKRGFEAKQGFPN
ncbi:hypothetical protein L7F22_009169 [Adiantum nelumboides]|nr:hypothetical protein [Adiantum nelumboides]